MPNVTFGIRLEGQDHTRRSTRTTPTWWRLRWKRCRRSRYRPATSRPNTARSRADCSTSPPIRNNQLHGSAYGYFVNEALHAGQPFTDNGTGNHIRPKDRKQDYGGQPRRAGLHPENLQRPKPDVLLRQHRKVREPRQHRGNFATVPTEAFRNGDFGSILTGRRSARTAAGRSWRTRSTTRLDADAERLPRPRRVPGQRHSRDPDRPVAAKIQAYLPAAHARRLIQELRSRPAPPCARTKSPASRSTTASTRRQAQLLHPVLPRQIRQQRRRRAGAARSPQAPRRLHRTPTVRLNYDYSITPTMILHAGAGVVREHDSGRGGTGRDRLRSGRNPRA